MELRKTEGEAQIVVNFSSRAPQFEDEQEQEAEEEGQQEQQEEQYEDYCDFTIYVSKGGETMAVECSSIESEINVTNVYLVADLESHKKVPRHERLYSSYCGPEFSTLDERLQTRMIEYLKSYGINEEVAALVEHLSLDKEQRLYMKWLKDVSHFVESP